jgi:ferredoxin
MLLTKAAIANGAEPYGLGIWNAGFINHLYNDKQKKELLAYKAKVDPNNIMNPGKFFRVNSFMFNPSLFNFGIGALSVFTPILGTLATIFFGKVKKVDDLDFELTTHACAKCGNCIAVCPAYLVTGNEEMTAKGKIALAKKLIEGKPITKDEAEKAFMCMHCRACEEICQTNLELMNLWDALEKRIETITGGRPAEKIDEFIKKVDASSEYWEMIDRNN